MFNISKKTIYLIVIVFLFGYAVGYFRRSIPSVFSEPSVTKLTQANTTSKLKYTRPLLAFEVGEKKEFLEYESMQTKIGNIIKNYKTTNDVLDVSVYFRDLNNGRWTGINENDQFSPGSLLKVPLMIAYYKLAENNPNILQQKLTYDGKIDENALETIKPSETIQKGVAYSIDDLIRRMIIYSDNNAAALLFDNTNHTALNDIFSDLDIQYAEDKNTQDFLSTKQYSLFFRILYNATYLTPEMSERALSLLTQIDFRKGIQSGLPQNVAVAHKFGERKYTLQGGNVVVTSELHDCGIVYKQYNPYLLCIMTKGGGGNLDKLYQITKDISTLVYNNDSIASQ